MKKIRKMLVVAVATLGIGSTAVAAEINGAVSFNGLGWTPTGGSGISDATGVDFNTIEGYEFTVTPGTAVGDFTTLISNNPLSPTGGNITDFTFSPFVGPIYNFWTFMDTGGDTFAFSLESTSIRLQGSDLLTLAGTGTITHPDFDSTLGTWLFTAQQQGGSFSWSSSSATVPVPAALSLVGLGLLLIAGASRRRRQ